MYKHLELKNLENVLIEADTGGPILSEDVAILLDIQPSTAANILKTGHHRGYLSRKDLNKKKKFGARKYLYELTNSGILKVAYIRKNKLL